MANFLRTIVLTLTPFFFFLASPGLTQTVGSTYTRSLGEDVSDFFVGIGAVYASPLHWHGDSWLEAMGTGVLVGGAFLLDDEFRTMIGRNRSSFGDRLAEGGRTYGKSSYALFLAAGAYAAGSLTNTEWIRGTGFTLLQTLVSAGALNLALKTLVGRSRPYVGRGNHDFDFWSWDEESLSFPSGHTVVAFSISSVLAARWKNPWATAVLYGLAGVTAWSRMYTDDHWFSDVVFAAALTTAIGASLVRRYEGGDSDCRSGAAVHFHPTLRGMAVRIVF